MSNSPLKMLDADEEPVYQKALNSGLQGDPSVPVVVIDGPSAPTPVNIDFASADPQTIIVAPGVGYRIRITSLFLSSGNNMNIAMKSGATTIGTIYGQSFAKDWVYPLRLGANEAFVLDAEAADHIYGQICYYAEAIN